ncbi:MAG: aminotransferase class I/II-fold pyridoxal phosphate-dependent enzyme [Planctomycetota bacterium]|nr:aminotransferase class I/II-fold pyridoxal phosphate-dependent enzyme [Planctomycetota bacterium]
MSTSSGQNSSADDRDSFLQKLTNCQPGRPQFGPSTIAVHSGEARQKHGDAITDPIFNSSTYTFADTQSVIDFIEQKQEREEYGRYGNPSEKVVERKLAAIEGGESALLFTTGMSALVTLLMARLNAGDEVIFFDECYHRSREFCTKHLSRFGVVTRQVKACDYDAMEAAITPNTKMLISESPTNPHLSIVDLDRFADIGRRHNIETLIDATLGTPYNINPLKAGIDFVQHSATKYLGGHNDLLAGALIGTAEKLEPVRKLRGIMGTINSPQNIYLLERGLKTFELRMQRHNENGLAVAQFLASHPKIENVYYPGLPSHPYYEVAQRTMRGFGGLVTFLVKDADWRQTADVVDAVQIPRIGPSLGGVESLIEQPLVMSYFEQTPADRKRFGIPDNMIRMACGIENAADLIADLAQALDRLPSTTTTPSVQKTARR